jgi:hypothetical protein
MSRKKTDAKRQLDDLFLKVLGSMIDDVVKTSATASEQVIKLSSDFLSEKAQTALSRFHTLYFASAEVEQSKADVNADIDRMFDAVQGELAKGSDDAAIGKAVTENNELKEVRLQLAGVQKELETLISLESGIREKLVPVLTCMQFEDVMRQRLEHVMIAWHAIVAGIGPDEILDVELAAIEVEANLTSVEETAQFYRIVLKKEPPEGGLDSGGAFFDAG